MIIRQLIPFLFLSLFAFSANAQFPAPYCAWDVNNCEPITRVIFAGIDNSSSNATSSPKLENFTHIKGQVCSGATYNFQAAGYTDGFTNQFFVYIDWNKNNTFESNERYYVGATSTNNALVSTDIAVPANAVNGETRMRVVKTYGGNNNTDIPCGGGGISWGQAEDYTIIVGTPALTQVGYAADAESFTQLSTTHTDNALTHWTSGVCRGSGTSTPMPNLHAGVAYRVENNVAAANCTTHLSTAYLQVWEPGTTCNNLSPSSNVGTNAVDFIANYNGTHRLNVTSNICGSDSNTACPGGFGHDYSGQSAALRYRQVTRITNTTSTDTICVGGTKSITRAIQGSNMNPTVNISITQGSGLGTLSGTTFTATQPGLVTVRTTVGVLYDEVSFYISPHDTIYENITLCTSELPYSWNGINIPTTAVTGDIFTVNLPGQQICDDIHVLKVVINEAHLFNEVHNVCKSGLPFTWHGEVYGINTPVGDYSSSADYTTVDGCDSNYTLALKISPIYNHVEAITICDTELPFTWNGIVIPVGSTSHAAIDSFVFNTVNSCDSTVVLDLTINESYQESETIKICESELPYSWNNEVIPLGTSSGTIFTYEYLTQDGCDSIWTVEVIFNETYVFNETQVICTNELPFTWHNETYGVNTPVGNYNLTAGYTTVDGCDSVYNLSLTINSSYNHVDAVTICDTELPYTWNGIVIPVGSTSHTAIDSFVFTTINSCDSTVVLNLTINESYQESETLVLCDSELPYSWNDEVIPLGTTSGTIFTYEYLTQDGCDSVWTVEVIINETYVTNEVHVICSSELPFTWHSETYGVNTPAGNHNSTVGYTTVDGCDSIYNLSLTINSSYNHVDAVTICDTELPYTWNGIVIPVGSTSHAAIDSFVFNTASSCDSTVVLNLTINESYQESETLVLCDSELPYSWNDEVIPLGTSSGTIFTFEYLTQDGCDSVWTVEVIINETYVTDEVHVICSSELPFTWHSETYGVNTPAGNHNSTVGYTTVDGCDSIYNLSLTINSSYNHVDAVTICDTELPYTWNGIVIPVGSTSHAAIDSFVFNTASSCDSTVVLNLTINESYQESETLVLCDSELPYSWNDEVIPLGTTSGTIFTYEYLTQDGCDSIWEVEVIINETYVIDEVHVICTSELPFTWHSETYGVNTPVGNHNSTVGYTTVDGCDSTYNLSLTINSSYNHVDAVTICDTELPYTWNGIVIPVGSTSHAAIDSFVFNTASSCDSTVVLNLTINESYQESETLVLCDSELPYSWNDEVIPLGTNSGQVLTFNYLTEKGCDSIWTVEVIINETYEFNEVHNVCTNELPFNWHGETWAMNTGTGTYTETVHYTTINGCDSVYNLTLNVYPIFEGVESITICSSQLPYTWNGIVIPVGSTSNTAIDSFIFNTQNGCDSTIVLDLTINQSYLETVTLTLCESELPYSWNNEIIPIGTNSGQVLTFDYLTQDNCDSVWLVEVIVNPIYHEVLDVVICDGETYEIGGHEFTQPVTNHTINFLTINGCDSVFVLNLQVNDPIVIDWDGDLTNLCEGDSFVLDATTPHVSDYSWNNGSTASSITITEGGVYTVHLIDEDGACEATATHEVIQRFSPFIPTLESGIHCIGDTVVLNGGSDGFKFLWSTGDTIQKINVTESGTYSVDVETIYGCESSATTSVEFLPRADFDSWDLVHLSGYKYHFVLTNPVDVLAYHWDFGDGNTSTVPQPIHEYEGPGVYTAFLTLTGECEDSEFYKIIKLERDVSVDDLSNKGGVRIYPNPANDFLEVSLEDTRNGIQHYKIWDAQGRLVLEEMDLNKPSVRINIESLTSGAYFIELITNDLSVKRTFMKVK